MSDWISRFNLWIGIRLRATPHTRRCVICEARATNFTGHVLLGPFWVIAGWCSTHQCDSPGWTYRFRFGRMGCHGLWWPWYGLWLQRWTLTPTLGRTGPRA